MSRPAHDIVLRLIFTEKSSHMMIEGTDARGRRMKAMRERGVEARPRYTFEVAPDANKIEIRKAVESLFEVKVGSVRTSNVRGKMRRLGHSLGRRPHWKKAVVELSEGTIDAFEGV